MPVAADSMNISPWKSPGALLPMAMSAVALLLVLGHIAIFGAARAPDEGAAAHIWQLLMAGQVPVIVYFAWKWLPRARGLAAKVLIVQILAAFAACSPVLWLQL